jgi:hypothetical protein
MRQHVVERFAVGVAYVDGDYALQGWLHAVDLGPDGTESKKAVCGSVWIAGGTSAIAKPASDAESFRKLNLRNALCGSNRSWLVATKRRSPMTLLIAFLVCCSIAVFLAHAFDAYQS